MQPGDEKPEKQTDSLPLTEQNLSAMNEAKEIVAAAKRQKLLSAGWSCSEQMSPEEVKRRQQQKRNEKITKKVVEMAQENNLIPTVEIPPHPRLVMGSHAGPNH